MAGSIVQTGRSVDDSGGTSTTASVTLTGVAAGNSLVAMDGWEDSPGTITTTASDGTSLPSAAAKVRLTADTQAQQIFSRDNVASGSHTVICTHSTATGFRRMRLLEVAGLEPTGSVDKATGAAQTPGGTGANAVSSGATAATTNANDFVMGFSQDTLEVTPGTGTVTAGSGYTISGSDVLLSVESKSVAATGAQTATFTQSVNNNRITHVVAFKEAAAGGTVALTGQGGSLSSGALAPSTDKALSGQALTSAQGTLSPSAAKALSGQVLASAAGTLIPSISIALTGQALAIAQGSVSTGGDVTLALTGQALSLTAGTLAPGRSIPLGGSAMTSSAGTLVPATSKALTGFAIAVASGLISPAIARALSGNLLSIGQGTVTVVTGVTVALTGQSLSLQTGTMSVSASVRLTGQALSGTTGSLTVSGGVTEIVPYLIEDTLAAALMRIASIRCVANVIGSSGSVTAQDPAHMTVVPRGTTVTITLGGTLYTSNQGNSRARAPYGAPDAIPSIRRKH